VSAPLATSRLPPRSTVGTGSVVGGRYRLEELIGWGGQALVFRAANTRPAPGEPDVVALKVARVDLPPQATREAADVLLWETTLLRRLRHPALPRLWRSANDGGLVWLARDLAPGRTLAGMAPQPAERVRSWATQLCELLLFLHTQSPPVICGDIKPANIVLRPDETLMLIDIGAAHTRTRRPPRRPRPRHGTPGYAAPEQMGAWAHDERADLFSLAVTCYELLTGIDPTVAPLQFDLARLDQAAPDLSPILRWALTLDPQRRAPTAATLLAKLRRRGTPPTLPLRPGVRIASVPDLLPAALQHPLAVEAALAAGTFERWLIEHPDPRLGRQLLSMRRIQEQAPAPTRRLDMLLSAMAPSDGSPLLRVEPAVVRFGHIPLMRWRLWSPPVRVTLHNGASEPLRWELTCPRQIDADVRVLSDGRPARSWSGVITPGGRVGLDLVAVGRTGQRQGTLTLRCGNYTTSIPWQAEALPCVPVSGVLVTRLADLDLANPDLLAQLEQLGQIGALQRWLASQRERGLAAEVDAALQAAGPTARRLLLARVPHHVAPIKFPLLQIGGTPAALQLTAGQRGTHELTVTNQGSQPCVVEWSTTCPWAQVVQPARLLGPGERSAWTLLLAPPAALRIGAYPVDMRLRAGQLDLPGSITAYVAVQGFWQKVRNWLG
jgi:serine/threonine protein kinase